MLKIVEPLALFQLVTLKQHVDPGQVCAEQITLCFGLFVSSVRHHHNALQVFHLSLELALLSSKTAQHLLYALLQFFVLQKFLFLAADLTVQALLVHF